MDEYFLLSKGGENPKQPISKDFFDFTNNKCFFYKENDKRVFTNYIKEARLEKYNVGYMLKDDEIIFDLDKGTTIKEFEQHIQSEVGGMAQDYQLPPTKIVKTRGGSQIWYKTSKKIRRKSNMSFQSGDKNCIVEVLTDQTTAVPNNAFGEGIRHHYTANDKEVVPIDYILSIFLNKINDIKGIRPNFKKFDGNGIHYYLSRYPKASLDDIVDTITKITTDMAGTLEGERNSCFFNSARSLMKIGWDQRQTSKYLLHLRNASHPNFPIIEMTKIVENCYVYDTDQPKQEAHGVAATAEDIYNHIPSPLMFCDFQVSTINMMVADTGVGKTRALIHIIFSLLRQIEPITLDQFQHPDPLKLPVKILWLTETSPDSYYRNVLYHAELTEANKKEIIKKNNLFVEYARDKSSELGMEWIRNMIVTQGITMLFIDGLQFLAGAYDVSDPRIASKICDFFAELVTKHKILIFFTNHLTKGQVITDSHGKQIKVGQMILGGQRFSSICDNILSLGKDADEDHITCKYTKRRIGNPGEYIIRMKVSNSDETGASVVYKMYKEPIEYIRD